MSTVVIGIDNGVTGSVAILKQSGDLSTFPTPTTKKWAWSTGRGKSTINNYRRIDSAELVKIFGEHAFPADEVVVFLERPMIQGGVRFLSSISAAMCHADTTNALSTYAKAIGAKLTINVIDSKKWQSLTAKHVPGKRNTKEMSKYFAENVLNFYGAKPDSDAVCIAFYGGTKCGITKYPKIKKGKTK